MQILDVCPSFYLFKEPVMSQASYINPNDPFKLPLTYRIYNPVGATILQNISLRPAFLNAIDLENKFKRYDELLQIVLSKRLGKNLDLNTLSYGDEYIIDVENKKIFSPKPDSINYPEDDISLPINPEVLGFTE